MNHDLMKLFLCLVVAILPSTGETKPKQMRPTNARVQEITVALNERGYKTQNDWLHVQETCRQIASEHGWQTNRAPDARVLILLGLGNENSNPEVIGWEPNRLDEGVKQKP